MRSSPVLVTIEQTPHRRITPLTWLVLAGTALAVTLTITGLPPFGLPMPTWSIGIVTPTCGLTRASVALAKGDLATAWAFNPAAFAVALLAAITLTRLALGTLTKRWLSISLRVSGIAWAILIAIWWANQQLHADLIIHGTLP